MPERSTQEPAPGGEPSGQIATLRYRRGKVGQSIFLRNYRRSPLWTEELERRLLDAASRQLPRKVGDKEFAAFTEQILEITRFQAARLFFGRIPELSVGPYLLFKLLGKGGQGLVFAARNREADRFCALKVMPPEATQDEVAVKRMRAEALMLDRIAHPNVVEAYGLREIPKPQDLPEGEVWIFSQTAEQIQYVTDRYHEAPPNAQAHPYYTQRDRTRRKVMQALGVTGALLVTACVGVGAWMLERSEADRSSVTLSSQQSPDAPANQVTWDLRDRRLLEVPEGSETYDLGDQRLTLIPTTDQKEGDSQLAVHSLIEGPQLRLLFRDDGNARVASRPESGGKFTVEENDTKIPQALGGNPEEVEKFLTALMEMKDPAPFLQQWLRSRLLWKFIDDIAPHLRGNPRLQDDLERLREKLAVELPGFGPYCLSDAAMLPSPDGKFVLCNLPLTFEQMTALYLQHPLPEEPGETHPLRIRRGARYKCILLCEPQSFRSGENPQFFYVASPVVAGTQEKIRRFGLSENGRAPDLRLTRKDRDIFEILNQFRLPDLRTSPQQLHPIRIPASYVTHVDQEIAKPARAAFELLSAIRGLLFRPDLSDPDLLRPDPDKNLWWPVLIPNLRLWNRAWAQSAVGCGARDYGKVRHLIEGF